MKSVILSLTAFAAALSISGIASAQTFQPTEGGENYNGPSGGGSRWTANLKGLSFTPPEDDGAPDCSSVGRGGSCPGDRDYFRGSPSILANNSTPEELLAPPEDDGAPEKTAAGGASR